MIDVSDDHDVHGLRRLGCNCFHAHIPCIAAYTAGSKTFSARPQGAKTARRTDRYVEDFATRERSSGRGVSRRAWGRVGVMAAFFSMLASHVAVFAQQLHPSPFVLGAPRPFGDRRMAQFFNDIVHRFGGGLDGKGAWRTSEASIASAVAFVQIQIHEGDIL